MTVTASGGGVTHTTIVSLTVPQTNVFGIAPPDHVVIVIEENHAFASIIGSSSAPYINSLAQQGALFTQSFAVEHPSQPNYLDIFSGRIRESPTTPVRILFQRKTWPVNWQLQARLSPASLKTCLQPVPRFALRALTPGSMLRGSTSPTCPPRQTCRYQFPD